MSYLPDMIRIVMILFYRTYRIYAFFRFIKLLIPQKQIPDAGTYNSQSSQYEQFYFHIFCLDVPLKYRAG